MNRICAGCSVEFSARRLVRHCDACRPGYEAAMRSAIKVVTQLRRTGDLQKASAFNCDDCGNPASVWDHRDYGKPDVVRPLCRNCNWRRPPAKFTAAALVERGPAKPLPELIWLKRRIRESQLGAGAIAAKAGVSRKTIERISHGKALNIRVDVYHAIRTALSVGAA